MRLTSIGITLLILCGAAPAQTGRSVELSLRETAGIRRTTYPVNARVPLTKGALSDPAKSRLILADAEVPAQIAAESKWPDGSVEWLTVDFNSSVGPLESLRYRLEYGDGVQAKAVATGLNVSDGGATIDVGRVKFNKAGAPLIASVKYRAEDIGNGANGLVVTDAEGKEHDLAGATDVTAEVVKRGPLYVLIRYTGKIAFDANYRAAFTLNVEMPNSKSWVKMAATVQDPGKRVKEISLRTPLALGPLPWEWDFGTDRWTYGVFRQPGDRVDLNQAVKAAGVIEWKAMAGTQTVEAGTADPSKLIRWGHIQDGKEVIAFAVDTGATQAGTYSMSLDGGGQTAFRFRPAAATAQHRITVYEHYVASPVQIGAATSPASILAPLVVTIGAKK